MYLTRSLNVTIVSCCSFLSDLKSVHPSFCADKLVGKITTIFGGNADSDGDGIPDSEDDDDDNDGIPDSKGKLLSSQPPRCFVLLFPRVSV